MSIDDLTKKFPCISLNLQEKTKNVKLRASVKRFLRAAFQDRFTKVLPR